MLLHLEGHPRVNKHLRLVVFDVEREDAVFHRHAWSQVRGRPRNIGGTQRSRPKGYRPPNPDRSGHDSSVGLATDMITLRSLRLALLLIRNS